MTIRPPEPDAQREDSWFRALDRLVPSTLRSDPEALLRARVLVAGSLTVGVVGAGAIAIRYATAPADAGLAVGVGLAATIAALPWVQRWSRSYRLTGGLFIALLSLGLPLFHLLLGFFPAPALGLFSIVPLLGSFFVGARVGLGSALVMIVLGVVLRLGLPAPAREQVEILSWSYVTMMGATSLVCVAVVAAFDHARRQSQREIERARSLAEAASRGKTEFLRHMSHELRTPLTAILGYGELLEEELADAGEARFVADVAKIRGASAQLLSLINDLLDISRIEAGALDLEISEFAISPLLVEVRDTSAPLADANHNQIEVTIDVDTPRLRSDRRRLRQVLLNLTSNACKFTQSGRVVLSAASADGGGVVLQVQDSGVGMDKDQLARIFEPFVQVHPSIERRRQGSGLGLTISRRLVEALGGALSVDSEPGRGTQFTVRLPRAHPSSAIADPVSGPIDFAAD